MAHCPTTDANGRTDLTTPGSEPELSLRLRIPLPRDLSESGGTPIRGATCSLSLGAKTVPGAAAERWASIGGHSPDRRPRSRLALLLKLPLLARVRMPHQQIALPLVVLPFRHVDASESKLPVLAPDPYQVSRRVPFSGSSVCRTGCSVAGMLEPKVGTLTRFSVALVFLVALTAACMPEISCTADARSGIAVHVFDAETGQRIVGRTVEAEAHEGVYVDRAGGDLGMLGLAYERPGTYQVRVQAPGYEPWIKQGVRVWEEPVCLHVIPVVLKARLSRSAASP